MVFYLYKTPPFPVLISGEDERKREGTTKQPKSLKLYNKLA